MLRVSFQNNSTNDFLSRWLLFKQCLFQVTEDSIVYYLRRSSSLIAWGCRRFIVKMIFGIAELEFISQSKIIFFFHITILKIEHRNKFNRIFSMTSRSLLYFFSQSFTDMKYSVIQLHTWVLIENLYRCRKLTDQYLKSFIYEIAWT